MQLPEPTTGLEPVTSSLPRRCYYRLSYVGPTPFININSHCNNAERETGLEPATLSLEGLCSAN